MPFRWNPREHISLGIYVLKWTLRVAPVAALIGSVSALFLWSLERVSQLRLEFPWLLFGLPLVGIGISFIYIYFGKVAEGGNNLLMEAIHGHENDDSSVIVPGRMAPLILVSTVATHLFGGSAGREGTAVQMGGSIASVFGRWFRLNSADMRTLLMVGISAGFAGVFGTPLTGAVFAMEVLAVGRMNYDSIIPCLIAAVISDWVCAAWGITHTHYAITSAILQAGALHINWILIGKISLASIAFGLTSVLFAELTHGINHTFKRAISSPYLRPVAGGILIIGLTYLLGTRDYLGLGVSSSNPKSITLLSSFLPGGVTPWSWWWKLLFTAITLGSGFKGGEVTPLFFIGAALGNVLGTILGVPVDLFAALGFIAVFAGATNTPLACTLMGIELFGAEYTLYFAIASFLSYLFSGHSGIYLSQRIGTPKFSSIHLPPGSSLRSARELRPGWEFTRWREKSMTSIDKNKGELSMPHRYNVNTREIGEIRIYMTPNDRRENTAKGLKKLISGHPPLYVEIIKAAKQDGFLNATAHHTHYGYSGNGNVQANNLEITNPHLNLCVEIIGLRDELEVFCRRHGDLLKGKVVIYKHIEHWEVGARSLKEIDASENEYTQPEPIIEDDIPVDEDNKK